MDTHAACVERWKKIPGVQVTTIETFENLPGLPTELISGKRFLVCSDPLYLPALHRLCRLLPVPELLPA